MHIFIGLLSVLVGLVLVTRGSLLLRVLIAIWAAFAGFFLGGGVVAAATGDTFLADALAVSVAVVCGLAFGLVAYLFYAVAILIAMMAFGFTLGTDLLVALGVSWTWLVVLGGVALGLLFGALAVFGDLPMIVLIVLSSFAGASAVVSGLMMIFGILDPGALSDPATTEAIRDDWWWYLLYLGLALAGVVAQSRLVDSLRAGVRDEWSRSPRAAR